MTLAEKQGVKARAEAIFLKKEQQLREGDKARAQYEFAAREVDKNTRKPSGVEIHRDCVLIPDFLDGGAVAQHVKAGKPVNLEPAVDPVYLRCRRF